MEGRRAEHLDLTLLHSRHSLHGPPGPLGHGTPDVLLRGLPLRDLEHAPLVPRARHGVGLDALDPGRPVEGERGRHAAAALEGPHGVQLLRQAQRAAGAADRRDLVGVRARVVHVRPVPVLGLRDRVGVRVVQRPGLHRRPLAGQWRRARQQCLLHALAKLGALARIRRGPCRRLQTDLRGLLLGRRVAEADEETLPVLDPRGRGPLEECAGPPDDTNLADGVRKGEGPEGGEEGVLLHAVHVKIISPDAHPPFATEEEGVLGQLELPGVRHLCCAHRAGAVGPAGHVPVLEHVHAELSDGSEPPDQLVGHYFVGGRLLARAEHEKHALGLGLVVVLCKHLVQPAVLTADVDVVGALGHAPRHDWLPKLGVRPNSGGDHTAPTAHLRDLLGRRGRHNAGPRGEVPGDRTELPLAAPCESPFMRWGPGL
mmetsp:Transcript_16770/g.50567  ORF Transcript_16770/g.50567 Transcript_16770/m.50567 type:complete len:428 (-) Transcript_16770:190-1473(-)